MENEDHLRIAAIALTITVLAVLAFLLPYPNVAEAPDIQEAYVTR